MYPLHDCRELEQKEGREGRKKEGGRGGRSDWWMDLEGRVLVFIWRYGVGNVEKEDL